MNFQSLTGFWQRSALKGQFYISKDFGLVTREYVYRVCVFVSASASQLANVKYRKYSTDFPKEKSEPSYDPELLALTFLDIRRQGQFCTVA